MSKWKIRRVPMATPRLAMIALSTAVGIGAAIALPHVNAGDADCWLFQARLETTEYPALELHLCAMIPSTGGGTVVRYDVAVRVAMMPARPR